MSRFGDAMIRCCSRLHGGPIVVLCILIYLVQAGLIDYYLVRFLGAGHYAWLAGDAVVLIVLVVTIATSANTLQRQRSDENADNYSMAWATWMIMHALLACKVIIIFMTFSTRLEEEGATFFGANTLKTAIALGSIFFNLLLLTQHDAPVASERRKYIEDLTGTVIFDLLDTTDILEILFDADDRAKLASGVAEVILAVATLNLLIPTIPLLTLSKTQFGNSKLSKNLVSLHKMLVILAVNVPNLLVRLILWHGFSLGVSPFMLKNILLIVLTLYEFYEHKQEKYEEHERERKKGGVENDDNEDSFDNDSYDNEDEESVDVKHPNKFTRLPSYSSSSGGAEDRSRPATTKNNSKPNFRNDSYNNSNYNDRKSSLPDRSRPSSQRADSAPGGNVHETSI